VDAREKRVLVVDDETDVQEFLALILSDHGFQVDCASQGEEALAKIEALRPDLVVLDLMMPVMDGWGVLERLKRLPDRPAVIILTAYPDEWRAFKAGAWELLQKPFQPEALVEVCERALAGS
jgi:CheY-like chemotaxis protein